MATLALNKILRLGINSLIDDKSAISLNDWLQLDAILKLGIRSYKVRLYKQAQKSDKSCDLAAGVITDKFKYSLCKTNQETGSFELILRQSWKAPIKQNCHSLYVHLDRRLGGIEQALNVIEYHVARATPELMMTMEWISDKDTRLPTLAVHSYGEIGVLADLAKDLANTVEKTFWGHTLEGFETSIDAFCLWQRAEYAKRHREVLQILWNILWEGQMLSLQDLEQNWPQLEARLITGMHALKTQDFVNSNTKP